MIKCCKEHVDRAMEIIIDQYETAPDLKQLTEDEKLSTTCEYCQNEAIYMVSNT